MSDPICYFEFHNHQRVQIRALETVGVVLERTDRGGACNEFLVAYYWEGQRRTEWMRPFELADEPKKARSVIAPPSEAAAAADESLCPAPAQQPAAAVSAEEAIEAAYWDFDARHKGYGPHKITPQSERDAFKWAVRAIRAAGAHGTTQDALLDALPSMSYPTLTARFSALLRQGRIADTGERRLGRSGRAQRVLVAT